MTTPLSTIRPICLICLISLITLLPTHSATITNLFLDAQGAPRSNTEIRIHPLTTPLAQSPSIITGPIIRRNTDAAGAFTVNLTGGRYMVQVGISAQDRFQIAVPVSSLTYDMLDLIITPSMFAWPPGAELNVITPAIGIVLDDAAQIITPTNFFSANSNLLNAAVSIDAGAGSTALQVNAAPVADANLTDSTNLTWSVAGATVTATVPPAAISDAQLRASAATSVIGRAAGTSGPPADITASSDGVLRRHSGTLGFGTLPSNLIEGLIDTVNLPLNSADVDGGVLAGFDFPNSTWSTDGSGVPAWRPTSTGIAGTVLGPASSTLRAIPIYADTTGTNLISTPVTISTGNDLSGIAQATLAGGLNFTPTDTHVIGPSGARPTTINAGPGGLHSAAGISAGTYISLAGTHAIDHVGRAKIYAPSDGVHRLTTSAGTGYNQLQLGPANSSHPALYVDSTAPVGVRLRLGDDTAYANFQAQNITAHGTTTTAGLSSSAAATLHSAAITNALTVGTTAIVGTGLTVGNTAIVTNTVDMRAIGSARPATYWRHDGNIKWYLSMSGDDFIGARIPDPEGGVFGEWLRVQGTTTTSTNITLQTNVTIAGRATQALAPTTDHHLANKAYVDSVAGSEGGGEALPQTVLGPTSSTLRAVPIYADTTGTNIISSPVTISTDNDLSGIAQATLAGNVRFTPTDTYVIGPSGARPTTINAGPGGLHSAAGISAGTYISLAGTHAIDHVGRAKIYAPSDGVHRFTSSAGTGYSQLQLGPANSSHPALHIDSTAPVGIRLRLGNDTGYASFQAQNITAHGNLIAAGSVTSPAGYYSSLFLSGNDLATTLSDLSTSVSERLTVDGFEAYVNAPHTYDNPRSFTDLIVLKPTQLSVHRITSTDVSVDWDAYSELEITAPGDISISELNRPTSPSAVSWMFIAISNAHTAPITPTIPAGWIGRRGVIPESLPPGNTLDIQARCSNGQVIFYWQTIESDALGSPDGGTGRTSLDNNKILVGSDTNPVKLAAVGEGLELTNEPGTLTLRARNTGAGITGYSFVGDAAGTNFFTNATPVLTNTTLHLSAWVPVTDPAAPTNSGTFEVLGTFHYGADGIAITNEVRGAIAGDLTVLFQTNSAAYPVLTAFGADGSPLIASVFIQHQHEQVFTPVANPWSNVIFQESFEVVGAENPPAYTAGTFDLNATDQARTGSQSLKFEAPAGSSYVRWYLPSTYSTLSGSFFIRLSAHPSSARNHLEFYDSNSAAGNIVGALRINSLSYLQVRHDYLTLATSAAPIPHNTWVRIDWHWVTGTDGTDGYIKAGWSDASTKTTDPDNMATLTTATGTAGTSIGQIRHAVQGGGLTTTTWHDDIVVDPSFASWDAIPSAPAFP